jgi:hypothetical protein
VCGSKSWNIAENHYNILSKKKCLLLSKKQIEDVLVHFIDNGVTKRIRLYKNTIKILKELYDLFNNQYMYQFYAR